MHPSNPSPDDTSHPISMGNIAPESFNMRKMGLIIWELEDMNDVGSFRLLTTNPSKETAVVSKMAHLVGKTMREGFPDLMKTPLPHVYREVIQTGSAREIPEFIYKGPLTAEPVTVAIKVFPLGGSLIGVFFENITHLKKEEKKLSSSSESWHSVWSEVANRIAEIKLDGTIISTNWDETKGPSLIGKSVYDYLPDQEQVRFQETLDTAVREEKALSYEIDQDEKCCKKRIIPIKQNNEIDRFLVIEKCSSV